MKSKEIDFLNRVTYSTEYIASIINAMSDMVRVIGRDGQVLMTNSAFDERFGYEEEWNAIRRSIRKRGVSAACRTR